MVIPSETPDQWQSWTRYHKEASCRVADPNWVRNVVEHSRKKLAGLSERQRCLFGEMAQFLEQIHEYLLADIPESEDGFRSTASAAVLYFVMDWDEVPDNDEPEGFLDDLAVLEHFRPILEAHLATNCPQDISPLK